MGSSHLCISLKESKFKHTIYFNSQLFWEKESGSLCGRCRNYQSLSMQDRCMICLGAKWLLLFVLLCGSCQCCGMTMRIVWRCQPVWTFWLNSELYPSALGFVDNKFGLAFAFWLFDLQFMGILAMVGNFWPLLDVGWFTESGLQTSQPQHYKFT